MLACKRRCSLGFGTLGEDKDLCASQHAPLLFSLDMVQGHCTASQTLGAGPSGTCESNSNKMFPKSARHSGESFSAQSSGHIPLPAGQPTTTIGSLTAGTMSCWATRSQGIRTHQTRAGFLNVDLPKATEPTLIQKNPLKLHASSSITTAWQTTGILLANLSIQMQCSSLRSVRVPLIHESFNFQTIL